MPSTCSRYMKLEEDAAEVSATVLTVLTVLTARKSTLRRQPSYPSFRRITTHVALKRRDQPTSITSIDQAIVQ
jgi:hypothetical protein